MNEEQLNQSDYFDEPPEHIESEECWCEPELEYEDPETGNQVWVHREVHQMDKNQIIDKLIVLRDVWYETEKITGIVVWGECAYEIDTLIEKAAEGSGET